MVHESQEVPVCAVTCGEAFFKKYPPLCEIMQQHQRSLLVLISVAKERFHDARVSPKEKSGWRFPIQGSSTLKAFFHTKKVSSMITTCIQHNFFIHLTFKAFINSVSNPIVQNFLHFLARMCKYNFFET